MPKYSNFHAVIKDLRANKVDDLVLEEIGSSSNDEKSVLENFDDIQKILDAIAKNTSLEFLNVFGYNFFDPAAEELAVLLNNIIRIHPKLELLRLERPDFVDWDALHAKFPALKKAKTQTELRWEQQQGDVLNQKLVFKSCLGKGSFGNVYSANYLGIPIAVKVLKKLSDKEFSSEISNLEKLNHPSIIKYFGNSTEGKLWKIIFELMDISLDDFLKKEGKSLAKLSQEQIALKIVEGVAYLHGLHIIHCDLKSMNIVLTLDFSKVKICDFGVAFNELTIGKFPLPCGTWAWWAPELLQTGNARNTAETDIWSFGVVIWEILTRGILVPYQDCDNQTMINNIKQGGKLKVAPEVRELSPLLSHIMDDCWQKEPLKRPSAAAIVRQLDSKFSQSSSRILEKLGTEKEKPKEVNEAKQENTENNNKTATKNSDNKKEIVLEIKQENPDEDIEALSVIERWTFCNYI